MKKEDIAAMMKEVDALKVNSDKTNLLEVVTKRAILDNKIAQLTMEQNLILRKSKQRMKNFWEMKEEIKSLIQ